MDAWHNPPPGDFIQGTIHLNVDDPKDFQQDYEEQMLHVMGVAMLQFTKTKQFGIKAGLKHCGKEGEKSVVKELTQIHDMKTFFPKDPKTMTAEEKGRCTEFSDVPPSQEEWRGEV